MKKKEEKLGKNTKLSTSTFVESNPWLLFEYINIFSKEESMVFLKKTNFIL